MSNTASYESQRLTRSAINGAIIPPIRAQQELAPIPAFLTVVGNNSDEKIKIMAKAAAAPSFPTIANTTVSSLRPENFKRGIQRPVL